MQARRGVVSAGSARKHWRRPRHPAQARPSCIALTQPGSWRTSRRTSSRTLRGPSSSSPSPDARTPHSPEVRGRDQSAGRHLMTAGLDRASPAGAGSRASRVFYPGNRPPGPPRRRRRALRRLLVGGQTTCSSGGIRRFPGPAFSAAAVRELRAESRRGRPRARPRHRDRRHAARRDRRGVPAASGSTRSPARRPTAGYPPSISITAPKEPRN